MGSILNYKCDSCELEYSDDGSFFYFSEDLKRYDENMLLMLTGEEICKSPLKGTMDLAYCNDCNRLIKIYTVEDNETDLSNEEIERMILDKGFDGYGNWGVEDDFIGKYLKENDLEKMVVFGLKRDSVTCSGCGRQLDVLGENVKCPKCNLGKIVIFNEILAD